MAPKFVSGRSSLAVIDAEIGKDAEGVLFAVGGISAGFTVYMDKGFLKAEYNAMTLNRYKIASESAIPTGKVKIEVETKYDSTGAHGPGDRYLNASTENRSARDALNDRFRLPTPLLKPLMWARTSVRRWHWITSIARRLRSTARSRRSISVIWTPKSRPLKGLRTMTKIGI